KAQAESKDGVLKITIPKDEKKKLKEIPIKIIAKK
ncbi:MAG: Hsp20 family protein, partial [Candidatus Pacebacteria bacterium]|nr:Hsp20 family protein [Candidatus Paceibacterota bacterium]